MHPLGFKPTKEYLGQLAISLKGENVHCVVCGNSFLTFLPFGVVNKRSNAFCPSCYSLERHRLLWLFLQRETELFSESCVRLLHVAPEICFFKRFRELVHIEYHPIDFFEEGYEYPEGTRIEDLCALSYSDAQFDVFLCIHVLEHIQEEQKALAELWRVLRPGGWGVVIVPIEKELAYTLEDSCVTNYEEREKLYGQGDHVRLYGQDTYTRLAAAGFTVDKYSYSEQFDRPEQFRLGFSRHTEIYLCRKPVSAKAI